MSGLYPKLTSFLLGESIHKLMELEFCPETFMVDLSTNKNKNQILHRGKSYRIKNNDLFGQQLPKANFRKESVKPRQKIPNLQQQIEPIIDSFKIIPFNKEQQIQPRPPHTVKSRLIGLNRLPPRSQMSIVINKLALQPA